MASKGVIAAGHPLTAEAGARALRDGGNAVDAAVAAVLMSWVCEPTLTGPGAGGFMLVHTHEREDVLLDFFVAAPGKGSDQEAGQLTAYDVADLLERLGREGAEFVYEGDVAAAISDWVLERGGLITRDDLAAYEVIDRRPAHASYHGRDILTNPPPSSGGILIAYSLDLLERVGRPGDLRALVEVMDETNRARTSDFATALHTEGYLERFLAKDALESVAGA